VTAESEVSIEPRLYHWQRLWSYPVV